MNSLSWFIYLTQIVDNLSTFAAGLLVCGIVIGIFGGMFIGWAIEDETLTKATAVKLVKLYAVVMVIAGLISIFAPDRRTMLLIAGSEIGQRAANSNAVQEIVNPGMDLLKTWIKRETEKLAAEATKK